MDSVSFVDKSFTKDLSYIDYNVSKNFFFEISKKILHFCLIFQNYLKRDALILNYRSEVCRIMDIAKFGGIN